MTITTLASRVFLFTLVAPLHAAITQMPASVIERGPHHRIVQTVTWHDDSNGGAVSLTNRIVELGTGMHYWNNGAWTESDQRIELVDGGALALHGQHRASFAANLNSAWSLEVQTADSKRFKSRIIGIAYFDSSTGNSVMIAQVKDTIGQLISENIIVYPDAFSDLRADVRYTYTISGIEQDLVLQEAPPTPAQWGLNPETSKLELYTEFIDAPAPTIRSTILEGQADPRLRNAMVEPDFNDHSLNFGMMNIGPGTAFNFANGEQDDSPIAVGKLWETRQGRTFLIERVSYRSLETKIRALPQAAALNGANQKPQAALQRPIAGRHFPELRVGKSRAAGSIQMAKTRLQPRSVVIDYALLNSDTNFTFKGDTTYFVSANVTLSGTNTVFESGTVIKYTNGVTLTVNTPVTWQGDAYRPVILTSKDDDSVGEIISGSTGNPTNTFYATTALALGTTNTATIGNFRIANAKTAISFAGGSGHLLSNAQLVNCQKGISATTAQFSLRNALFHNVLTNFTGSSSTGRVEHLTTDTALWLNSNIGTNLFLTNSLLVSVTSTGTYFGNSVYITNNSGAFQTVGAGFHYLSANSLYRNLGTTNINATMAFDLKRLTTYPPQLLSNNFTNITVLGSQAQRDTDTPDIGYHYWPLDYCWTGLSVTNATLILTNGVAIGVYGTNGIDLQSGGNLISEGSAINLNRLVRHPSVQEQPIIWGSNASSMSLISINPSNSVGNDIRLRFTDVSLLADSLTRRYLITEKPPAANLEFKNSQLRGAYAWFTMTSPGGSFGMTNNLCERDDFTWTQGDKIWQNSFALFLKNNLFLNASLDIDNEFGTSTAAVRDNLFDTVTLSLFNVTNSNNGYKGTTEPSGGLNDIILTVTDYKVGPLGNYYYPTNGGNLSQLRNAGSTTAELIGLFHWTTTTNQVKETNSIVDIGYHYVAITTNGSPIDTDGDTIPDYSEDRNGNGLADSGETSWTDPSPAVSITSPANGAIFYAITSTNLTLTANATDNGSITNVEFFNGTNKVGQTTNGVSNNYSITWSNVTSGSYAITARATDNLGAATVSAPINITVDTLPVVTLTNPADGANFIISPTNISLTASASDSDGTITNVAFYNGTNLIGQKTASPYTITWSNVIGGTYSLTAVAKDNLGGGSTSAVVNISVNSALDFGTNKAYVTFGTNSNLGLKYFTLECWFKRNGTGTVANTGTGGINAVPLVSKGQAENETGKTNMNYFLGIATNSNVLAADLEEFSNGANHPISGVTTISNGMWYHAAATYNGTNWQLFLNGGLEAQLAVGADPQYDSIQPAALATAITTSNTVAGSFNGVMDEVRIWSYARNQQQIRDNMDREIQSECGLVARWGLNEGKGTVVSNSAGSVINGTITGTGWKWTNSAPLNVSGSALFVVGSTPTNLSTADSTIRTHLQSLGYVVTVATATNVASTNAYGKTAIVISSSVASTNVNTKFRTSSVPVLTWKHDLYDDLGLVVSNSAYYGTTSGQTQLSVTNTIHPMAAGLSGTVTVVSNSSTFAWAQPNSNAVLIASTAGNPTNYVIFGYEKGAAMPGLVAPARRVGLFLSDTNSTTSLNTNGWALFDAALTWATTTPCPPLLDLMFVMDDSGSMTNNAPPGGNTPIVDARNDAKYFATNLNLALDRVGLVAFSSNAFLRQPLTHDTNAVLTAINNLTGTNGYTYIDRGLNTGQAELTGTNQVIGAAKVMILISDGQAEVVNWAIYAAQQAKAAGTRIITIGLGTKAGTNTMHAMASCGDEYYAPNTSQLATILTSITNTLCRVVVNLPPIVSITSPTNGQLFVASPTNILISATAADADGSIAKVEFFEGTNKLGELTVAPYDFIWQGVTNGTYSLTARAIDNSGASNTSAAVSITVNALPLVNIVAPTNNSAFLEITNVTLSASASDFDGTVTNVTFYSGTTVIGTSTAPGGNGLYNVTWNNRTNNSYPVVARAIDNRGGSAVSPIGLFNVTSTNSFPTVSITYPTNNSKFKAGVDITITATASDSDGSVTNVDFYVDGAILGSDPDSPYAITKCCWEPGTYVLIAKATDNLHATAISTPVTITVEQPPFVSNSGSWDPSFGFGASIRGTIRSLAIDHNGYLYAGGCGPDFATGLGPVAKWDGSTWTDLHLQDGGSPEIYAIKEIGNDIFAAGDHGINRIAKWDGTNWSPIGSQLLSAVRAIAYFNSDIYIGGDFSQAGGDTNIQYVSKLVGTNWARVGSGLTVTNAGGVRTITAIGQTIFIGGDFTAAGGNTNIKYLARLVGTNWTGVDGGVDGPVRALAACGDDLFVAGDFMTAGGLTNANCIAKWNKGLWTSLGSGVTGGVTNTSLGECTPASIPAPSIHSIALRGDDVFIAGNFRTARNGSNDLTVNHIAKATLNREQQQWVWSGLENGLLKGNESQEYGVATAIRESFETNVFELFVGGAFGLAGNKPSLNMARWVVGTNTALANAPIVGISSPANGAVFTNVTVISLTATATVSVVGTAISSVELFVDGTSVGQGAGTPPNYSINWSNPSNGVHMLTARAKDNQAPARSTLSSAIYVKVRSAGGPTANDDVFTTGLNYPPTILNVLTNDIPVGTNTFHIAKITPFQFSGGSVTIGYGATNLIYTPNANTFGVDIFSYTIVDSQGNTDSARVTVNIVASPNVYILSPADESTLDSPATLTVNGNSYGYNGPVTNVDLYVNGVKFGQTTNTSFSFAWTTNISSFYTFVAVAADQLGITNASDPVTLAVHNPSGGNHLPTAIISNLVSTVTSIGGLPVASPPIIRDGLFALNGQARDPDAGDPVAYSVQLYSPNDSETPIANVTPQPLNAQGFHNGTDTNGDLGVLDFSLLKNGLYDLQLTVHGGGDSTSTVVRVSLDTQLKIGQFSFSEQDLVIPVNGIPLTVIRTYNSLNPEQGDFGPSWIYALNDMDVLIDEQRQTVAASAGDPEDPSDDSPLLFSLRTGGGRNVTLTLPNGQRTTFTYTPRNGQFVAYAEWKSAPAVHATLVPMGNNIINYYSTPPLQWQDGGDNTTYASYDIPGFILTDRDGTLYNLTRDPPGLPVASYYFEDTPGHFLAVTPHAGQPKLTSIVQRSGDKISITPKGIIHYNPTGAVTRTIWFDRDSRNRITALHDPVGGSNGLPAVKYVYNENTGNLVQVLRLTDRLNGTYVTNSYHYDHPRFSHYITTIENALGIPITRNDYDDSGRLIRHTDADGKSITYTHSLSNRTEVITDRLNNSTTYIYDTRGNVTRIINALNQTNLFAFDINNNKTNEVNALGQTNQFVYDANGFLLSSINALNQTNTFTYNGNGQVLTAIDALGHGSTNSYDSSGNLTNSVDALGNATVYLYDSLSRIVSQVDPLGSIVTNQYDGLGNLTNTATLNSQLLTVSSTGYSYDSNGNRATQTAWWGTNQPVVTTFIYDGANRPTLTIDPDGKTNSVVYNEIGQQQSMIDKLGRTTSFEYDSQGRAIKTTYADGSCDQSFYDSEGRRTNTVDRAGRSTFYACDALGRVTQTIFADSSATTTVYDPLGRVAASIDPRGVTNAFGYDAAGHRTSATNALGIPTLQTITVSSYDAVGNLTNVLDALNQATAYEYDVLNRRIKTTFPATIGGGLRPAAFTSYDAAGRRVAETNEAGIVTRFGYDAASRLVAATNAWGTTDASWAIYGYDELGNQTTQVDALGRTTTYTYDQLGHRLKRTLPGAQAETFGYDAIGNLLTHTNFGGLVITNSYDPLNRLVERRSLTALLEAYSYSASGQLTNRTDASGAYSWTYDLRDRVRTNVTPAGTLYYAYDIAGNLTNLSSSTANGVSIGYAYDALNRLTNVVDARLSAPNNTTYGFDAVGNLASSKYPNSVTNIYQYDSRNRLTNGVWKLNASTLASFYYELAIAGNRTNLQESVNGTSRSLAWSYDPVYRLTNEVISGLGSLAYKYDVVGNRTNRQSTVTGINNQTPTYDTNDWLTTDTYDSNGNTTASGSIPYLYDYANRLTNANNGQVLITYNAEGQRTKKVANGITTVYLVDTRNPSGYAQVLEELTVSGSTNLSKAYTYGLDLISQRDNSAVVRFFGYDGHGSTRFLSDGAGALTDTYTYDAYGSLIASNNPTANAYLYCGEQFDLDLGVYFLRARYLKTDTGRFWTMDADEGFLSDPHSLHKYMYAHANPINRIDPNGNLDFIQMLASTKIGSTIIALGGPAIAVANRNLSTIVRGVAQGAQLAQRIVAAGGDVVAWEQRIRVAGSYIGRFRLDMVVRLPGRTINTLIESKGIPWNLFSRQPDAWEKYVVRVQNQANAFAAATHAANGQLIGERVIAFTTKIPQGLEAAGQQIMTAIGNNYNTVLWGQQMFEDFLESK